MNMKWLIKILLAIPHGAKTAGLKIYFWYAFMRTDLKKHFSPWQLILLSFLITGVVVCAIFMPLSKEYIFPKDNERYDISTIYVGQMKDFCPKEFEANPGPKEFETCATKLDINKMAEVKVPTFNETLRAEELNLPYMMKHSSDPKIRKAGEFFKEGNYFVIGIKVPEKYFSKTSGYIKNKQFDPDAANYNVLTFRAIRFGFACINGRCNNVLSVYNEYLSQIPLIGTDNSSNTVWIFGTENQSPHGVFLKDGIFVSKIKALRSTHVYYSFNVFGKSMFASIAFIALFLASAFCAIILRKFFDYPAFSYFTASTALWFVSINLVILFPILSGFNYQLFNIWLTLNFLLSILILNLAHARFKIVLNKKYMLLVAHMFILCLVLFVSVCFKDLGELISVRARIDLIFACIAATVSLVPLGFGISDLNRMLKTLKKVKDPRKSIYLDYHRRIKELRTYFVVWFVFCASYINFTYAGLGTGDTNAGEFFSLSIGLVLFLLTIMLHYTFSKELTHVASDPLSELERLNKRQSTAELCEIVKDPIKGILLLLDMANSSGKDARQKRSIMENLLNICNKEANKIGYYANYVKPSGDDWKIIFIKKNDNLADDLCEMTSFSVDNFSYFENCIKSTFEDSSIHISVFALEYRIYIDEKQETEAGYRTILDFSSREIDLMLKYLEKSKIPKTIMVAGTKELFNDKTKQLLLDNKVYELKDKEDLQERHKNLATELNICYGFAKLKQET